MQKSKVSFSVEKGFRYFSNKVSFFHFFMVQLQIDKKEVVDGYYLFKLLSLNNNLVYSKKIQIDSLNNRIITHNSHEDPLVQDEYFYYICFQIDSEKIIDFNENLNFCFQSESGNLIFSKIIEPLSPIYNKYTTRHYSKIIDNYNLVSDKDCIFTLHLGDRYGKYSEESFLLLAGETFNFFKYIQQYSYVGLQCSYEHESPEIEEKHIVIGQKGIYLSGFAKIENKKISSVLPFNEKYQQEYSIEQLTEITSIDELIFYYKNNKIKPKFFESNLFFLLPQYQNALTYSQDGLFSTKKTNGKTHFFLDVCKNCDKNHKCLQIIPSGLSLELLRKNITLENNSECNIYQLIND